jgi:K+-transporting ATPase ATPase C chain
MIAHLRACLWLLVFTIVLCSLLYPLSLWVVGQTLFPHQANGSLLHDHNGKAIGSRLIAQDFKEDAYFQPRPSAVSYNGATSGASNWAANNYRLRDRVARSVAGLVAYTSGPKKGQPVAPDVVQWFRAEQSGLVATWAKEHANLAQDWVKAEEAAKDFVKNWFVNHPADLASWRAENQDNQEPQPEDLAVAFFQSFAREHPGTWLTVAETKERDGKPLKRVRLVHKHDKDSADIASVFFDAWRQQHPTIELTTVPADMVMASASGLDPDLTLESARFQLQRVAMTWAETTKLDEKKIASEIEGLLQQMKFAPLGGFAGVDMVNVLEVNLALREHFGGKRHIKQ